MNKPGSNTVYKIAVTGGRDYINFDIVDKVMTAHVNKQEGNVFVIVGDCPTGLDFIVREWVKEYEIDHKIFEANWKLYHAAAGPIRNSAMLKEGKPDELLSFPGGKGTADMTGKCERANVTVTYITDATYDEDEDCQKHDE